MSKDKTRAMESEDAVYYDRHGVLGQMLEPSIEFTLSKGLRDDILCGRAAGESSRTSLSRSTRCMSRPSGRSPR